MESSIEASNDITSEKDAVANLNDQIDELKRELDAVKKKLQKAEFERDSARKSVENLKSEVKELSKKLHEERKRNAEGTRKNGNAVQSNDSINGKFISASNLGCGHSSFYPHPLCAPPYPLLRMLPAHEWEVPSFSSKKPKKFGLLCQRALKQN